MKLARLLPALALFVMAGMSALPAQADPIIWTLHGVTFDDGGTATGRFTYDAATNTYYDWNVSVTGAFHRGDFTYMLVVTDLATGLALRCAGTSEEVAWCATIRVVRSSR